MESKSHPSHTVLLGLWREACQHIKIEDSLGSILQTLQSELPIDQISVRRLESNPASLLTLAHTDPQFLSQIGKRQRLTDQELRKLYSWGKLNQSLESQASKESKGGLLKLLEPAPVDQAVIAVPLITAGQLHGCLLLYHQASRNLNMKQRKLISQLSDPFAAALANDGLVHEMIRLRQAAEADKGALLRRLGRTDLGDTIIGENTGIRPVMDRVKLVVDSDVPVLILGETGTGKELIARALHVRGKRSRGPFIRVNCGAIPAELIDSQLFGHEKGSFTGAEQARQGWFERADGGTLFLDEIGELPLEAQVRFLRVLQDGYVERVGGQHPIHVDVRVIAATHRDLPSMIREGRFREDLWYRLSVFPVLLPPLRERLNDLQELANFFAERAAARFGLAPVYPSQNDIRLLQSYNWPGNIRELGAVIDRAAILGNGERLEIDKALGNVSSSRLTEPTCNPGVQVKRPKSDLEQIGSLDEAMRSHIERALEATHGKVEGRKGAARVLKINPHTLRARMRRLSIDWTRFRIDE
jgi:hydrogenase-4 transcriptional activator